MKIILGCMLMLLTWTGCGSGPATRPSTNPVQREVTIDTAFENKFMPDTVGFAGGDGVYSQLLPDGRTVWIFGDTFIGNLDKGNTRHKTDPLYIRNSFVVFDGNQRITLQQGNPSDFRSMMIPPEVRDGTSGKTELERWYWPGDALVEEDRMYVFNSRFTQIDTGMWDFQFEGTDVVEFGLLEIQELRTLSLGNFNEIHFGHAICETDSFTYIYGLKDGYAHAARAKTGNILGKWDYFTGQGWSDDFLDAQSMVDFPGSEQFSVFPYLDQFIMVMQEGHLGRRIFAYTADTPVGPWSEGILVYETPLPGSSNLFTYNALAHPQFMKDNKLLISYNTNSTRLEDHFEDALIYRPRFIRVPMEMILGEAAGH